MAIILSHIISLSTFPQTNLTMAKNVIVLYSTPDHLNTISSLALLITNHHPSISIVILSTAASASTPTPSITYLQLPTPELPKNSSLNHVELFFEIPRLNNPNLKRALQQISQASTIKAFVVDFFCNSAVEVSTGLGIPTYFCNTTGAFGLCVLLHWPYIHDQLGDSVTVPGSPTLESSDLPTNMLFPQRNSYKHFVSTSVNMKRSAGIIVNSFHALEFRAMEALQNGLCVPDGPTPPIFSVGPLIDGGGGAADHECLRWLDLQPRESVVFLCFGRGGAFDGKQLTETAIGLERSGYRFLWVVRSPQGIPDLEAVLPDGFMGRVVGKMGFVVEGWAPQVAVLGHGSVGAFVTHCGQSSVLEAVSFGVPMIGWPLYAEQRMNRVFMVEEMKVAVALEMTEDGFVAAEELEGRVREVMKSQRGREIRRRVTEMKHSAAAAMRKGGSSVVALEKFVEAVIK